MWVKLLIGGVFAVLAAVLIIFIYWLLVKLTTLIWRLLVRHLPLDNIAPVFVLISLAIGAATFPGTVSTTWNLLTYFAQFTLVSAPQFIFNSAGGVTACEFSQNTGEEAAPEKKGELSTDEVFECLSTVGSGFASNFSTLIQALFEQRAPGPSVVYLLGFLGVVAVLLLFFGSKRFDESTEYPYFVRYFSTAEVQFRNRFAMGLILLVAVYLLLCAIAAVSLFKPSNISILSKAEFEEKLKLSKLDVAAAENNTNAFKVRFPEQLSAFLTPDRRTQLKDAKSVASLSAEYDGYAQIWSQIRLDIAQVQDRLLRSASADYELKNISRVGSREQALHFFKS